MFDEIIKNEFKTASKFFENALNSSKDARFAHAFMLTGNDMWAQYYFAIKIAKTLNCTGTKDLDTCNCSNCSWIRSNAHPEVITVSPIDFIQGDKKTVITVEQARKVKQVLSTTSSFYRVIIFTGANELKSIDENYTEYQNLVSVPNNPDNDRFWSPSPLNRKVFQEESANTLLKTIEEPNSNVVFFFLTRNKEDMIDTIVSRCQIIPVNSGKFKSMDYSTLNELFLDFPCNSSRDALKMIDKFLEITKSNNLDHAPALDMIEEYLRQLMKSNLNNRTVVLRLFNNIKSLEQAKKELKSSVNPNSIIENLFLEFAK